MKGKGMIFVLILFNSCSFIGDNFYYVDIRVFCRNRTDSSNLMGIEITAYGADGLKLCRSQLTGEDGKAVLQIETEGESDPLITVRCRDIDGQAGGGLFFSFTRTGYLSTFGSYCADMEPKE